MAVQSGWPLMRETINECHCFISNWPFPYKYTWWLSSTLPCGPTACILLCSSVLCLHPHTLHRSRIQNSSLLQWSFHQHLHADSLLFTYPHYLHKSIMRPCFEGVLKYCNALCNSSSPSATTVSVRSSAYSIFLSSSRSGSFLLITFVTIKSTRGSRLFLVLVPLALQLILTFLIWLSLSLLSPCASHPPFWFLQMKVLLAWCQMLFSRSTNPNDTFC